MLCVADCQPLELLVTAQRDEYAHQITTVPSNTELLLFKCKPAGHEAEQTHYITAM